DPRLAAARPDLAVKSKKNGKTWRDKKNLSWVDAASEEAWEYNIAVAKDAAGRGFDEINFDYIRFPSDGNLNDADFPFWNEKSPRRETLQKFFRRLNEELSGIPISADLFGLTTTGADDLGIGQVLEDAFGNFDYVAPMVYPSHFANGTFGFKNPAAHPYEVVKNSMESASKRLDAFYNATTTRAEINNSNSAVRFSKLRPWLQDFDLGADYDAKMVKAQIEASAEAKSAGWMLWDPKNVYTKEALISE
ncbi:MAG: putative glycoside hydrolase, partial [Patescibacteria group bacterium]